MGAIQIQLLAGDKVNSQTDYIDALPVNMSGVLKPMLGSAGYMLQQPGLTQYGTGEGIDRGGVWNDRMQRLFRASGASLIEVAGDGGVTVLGTSPSPVSSVRAAMPYSFQSQAVILDGRYFRYTGSGPVVEILDPDLRYPLDCVWVDGYYFFTDGEYLYHTDLEDETQFDPLAFATSEFSPDPTIGLSLTTDDKVIAWNRYTTEYFVNQGTDQFAFSRLPSRTVKFGLVGTACKAEIGGEFFFMGGPKEGNVSIYALGVGTAKNISSRTVDKIIAQYAESDLRECKLETRIVDQYPYLLVYLPNETLLFNFKVAEKVGTEQAWSQLKTGTGEGVYRAVNGVFDPRRAQWVYGDPYTSALCYLDMDVATHYGSIAEWLLFTPFQYLECQSLDELMIQTIPGFTTTDDASVFVSLTYNGVSYGNEAPFDYGKPSAYDQRFIVQRLGYVRNYFAFKFRGASRSRMAFSAAALRYS